MYPPQPFGWLPQRPRHDKLDFGLHPQMPSTPPPPQVCPVPVQFTEPQSTMPPQPSLVLPQGFFDLSTTLQMTSFVLGVQGTGTHRLSAPQ